MKIWDKINKIIEKISFVFLVIGCIAVAAMILLITASVIIRMFGGVANFSDELSGYLLVALVYCGLAYTQQQDKLIVVDILTCHLPKKVVKILKVPVYILGMAFLCIVIKYVWILIMGSIKTGTTSLSSMAIPIWIPQTPILLGLGLLTLRMFVEFINTIIDLSKGRKENDA